MRCPLHGHGGGAIHAPCIVRAAGIGKSTSFCPSSWSSVWGRDVMAWVCLALRRRLRATPRTNQALWDRVVAGIVLQPLQPLRLVPVVVGAVRRRAGVPGKSPDLLGGGGAVVAGGGRGKQGHLVDALAPRGDEGRGTLRKAWGSREQALSPRSPNGATPPSDGRSAAESIGGGGEPGELKHLSTRRKGHQPRLRQ